MGCPRWGYTTNTGAISAPLLGGLYITHYWYKTALLIKIKTGAWPQSDHQDGSIPLQLVDLVGPIFKRPYLSEYYELEAQIEI